jgi:putative endonuclease
MACYCYILQCADGSYYTGWSTDPEKRLHQHNAGRGGKYTRSRLPVQIIYIEELPDRTSAMRREHSIKGMTRKKKKCLVSKYAEENPTSS